MNADSKSERDETKFVAFNSYSPPKAESFLDALVKAQVRFEIECEDGASYTTLRAGNFGLESKIHVFVHRADVKKAKRIQKDLFGDIIP